MAKVPAHRRHVWLGNCRLSCQKRCHPVLKTPTDTQLTIIPLGNDFYLFRFRRNTHLSQVVFYGKGGSFETQVQFAICRVPLGRTPLLDWDKIYPRSREWLKLRFNPKFPWLIPNKGIPNLPIYDRDDWLACDSIQNLPPQKRGAGIQVRILIFRWVPTGVGMTEKLVKVRMHSLIRLSLLQVFRV